MQHQIHFDKKFYLDKKTGYWISSCFPKIRAHRWVWINYKGKIEKGFHIHHIDGNKSNNHISNLQKLNASEHLRMHMTPERRKKASEQMDVIRPLTKVWHRSKEGKEWHRQHAKEFKWGHFDLPLKNCDQCAAQYKPKVHHQNFCSNKCKSAWRRKMKLDDIEIVCLGCSLIFKRNKYGKSRSCSKKCAGIYRRSKNKITAKDTKKRECLLSLSKEQPNHGS